MLSMALKESQIQSLASIYSSRLKGQRLSKIVQYDADVFSFGLSSSGRLNFVLNSGDPYVYLSSSPMDVVSLSTPFSMLLRKEVSNAVIERVFCVNEDRVLGFELKAVDSIFREITLYLIAELIPTKANLILLDESKKVLGALRTNRITDPRPIFRGIQYEPPLKNDSLTYVPLPFDEDAYQKICIEKEAKLFTELCVHNDAIDPNLFDEFGVKRGLRDKDGNGVLAGITNISRIDAFEMRDGVKTPCDGKLWYRGYNVYDLIRGLRGKRYGFEEVAYLLLLGDLPNEQQLHEFTDCLTKCRALPSNFVRDVIMKAPSKDLMNSLTRSVLTLASYDDSVGDNSLQTQMEQCIKLISVFPMLAVYGYHAYNYYLNDGSMYIHRPRPELSAAENLLQMLRPDQQYTPLEAHVLDIALLLHMEHGGGNNSTFTTRVVTSSGADTYSVIAAALSSLKGPKHGGANIKVMEMMDDIRAHVSDVTDEDEMRAYIGKIVDKEAFDHKGLVYGMGHAVYSLSDPRAVVFKSFVQQLAMAKGRKTDFDFYNTVERLAPQVIAEKRHIYKGVSTNVDFYSGFVYNMLGIPVELYTPMFAVARVVGWSAHRMEELVNVDKIIRPAYKSVMATRDYLPMENRG